MIFLLAWRNIWRNKARSIVIMLSVAVGLLAGIAVLAIYQGMMKGRVRTVIDTEIGHLQIHHPEFKKDYHPYFVIPGDEDILKQVKSLPAVKAAAKRSIVQGMLVTPTGSSGVQVNGILEEQEDEVSGLKHKIIEGNGFTEEKKNEILVGRKLANKMKLRLGARLVLTFTDSADNLVSSAFRIGGIYQSSNAPLDEVNVYVRMQTLNELLLTGYSFHEIAIILNNDEDLAMVHDQLKKSMPSLLVESWQEISPETELLVKTVDEMSYIIMVIILIALAFGILNTMLMSVLERTREIGMMVALGTSKARIFFMVFLETIFLTLAGAPLGLAAGYFITNFYEKNGLDFSGMGEMMSSFGFENIIYPAFPAEKLDGVIFMVVGTAMFSCLLPAIKALRMQPVEALRR